MVGPLGEDAGGGGGGGTTGTRSWWRELEEQVVGGQGLDKQVVGAGARGMRRWVKEGGGGGGGTRGSKGGDK